MKKILALSVVAMALVGCQSTQQPVAPQAQVHECTFYGDATKPAPAWICSPEANREEYIRAAVGFSGNTAGGIAHQKNLAILQAKKELADQVKSEIITKAKSKTGTLGVEGSVGGSQATTVEMEAIANVELIGVEIIRSMRGADGYFYVHVGLPRQVFAQNVENVVEQAQQNNAGLSTTTSPADNKKLADDIAKALEGM